MKIRKKNVRVTSGKGESGGKFPYLDNLVDKGEKEEKPNKKRKRKERDEKIENEKERRKGANKKKGEFGG